MEERKTYTDEELSAVLEKHRVMLSVGTFIMYAAVVVILGGTLACAVFEIEELRYSLYIGFFIAFVGAVISAPHSKAIKVLLGEEMVVGALKDAFEQVEYHPGWGLPASLIGSAGMLFPEPYEVSKGSDSVKAVYKGMSIAFSDVELCKTEEHQKADNEWETREVTLYKGQWLVCDFQSKLTGDVHVSARKREKDFKGEKLIRTESEIFNKRFAVKADQEQEAFYILTPHRMENLLKIADRCSGSLYISFLRNGTIHIFVDSNENFFELGKGKADASELRNKFRSQIRWYTSMIETLQLTE